MRVIKEGENEETQGGKRGNERQEVRPRHINQQINGTNKENKDKSAN